MPELKTFGSFMMLVLIIAYIWMLIWECIHSGSLVGDGYKQTWRLPLQALKMI